MKRLEVFLFYLFVLSWSDLSAATGDNRIALVIGNSAYEHVAPLQNPINDAQAVAQSFRDVGFSDVTLVENADYRKMRLTLKDFSRKVSSADIAIVYFAGHGIEVSGSNYLIPTDARLGEAGDVEFETINFDAVMNSMANAQKLKMFILDACRDNPFIASMKRSNGTRSIGRGLARVEPGANTLVAYAAKSGTQALDGDGANSPFAEALVAELASPGQEIGYLFRRVRDRVLEQTGGRQEPFTYGSLGGDPIYLRPASQTAVAEPPSGVNGGNGAQISNLTEAATAWVAVKDTTSVGVLKAYIARYEGSIFADIAVARLKEIEPPSTTGPQDRDSDADLGGQADPQTPPPISEPSVIARTARTIPVGKWAEGIAFDGQNIWVSESGQRTIASVDAATGRIARRVKVGRLPVDMDTISDGRTFLLVHTDQLVWQQWPGDGRGGPLTKLNECPEALAASDEAIWVVTLPNCSSENSRAIRIDPNNAQKSKTGVLAEWAQAITIGHGRAWVAHARNGMISVIDASSLAVEEAYVDQASLWAITTNHAGVHAGGRIGDQNDQGLIVTIDPRTNRELHRHLVPSRIATMTADERNIVAVGGNGDVWVLSADGRELQSMITLGIGAFTASDVLITGDTIVISRQQQQGENGALLSVHDWRPPTGTAGEPAVARPAPTKTTGPSFPCSGSLNGAERTICNHPEIAGIDVEMSDTYAWLKGQLDRAGQTDLGADQRQWLRQRNSCGIDAECLMTYYLDRVAYLNEYLMPGDGPSSSANLPHAAKSWGGKVRSGPGVEYAQVGSLSEGEPIRILEKSDGPLFQDLPWFLVSYRGKTGYHWGGIICPVGTYVDGTYETCD